VSAGEGKLNAPRRFGQLRPSSGRLVRPRARKDPQDPHRAPSSSLFFCSWHNTQVDSAADLAKAERLIFPGVGAYEQAMGALKAAGLDGALADYVREGRPFLGICLGLQLLFDGSEENGGVVGLGLIPGTVRRFTCDRDPAHRLPVPHIGWNDLSLAADPPPPFLSRLGGRRVYFVHSFRAEPSAANADWVAATSDYGGAFAAAVRKGDVCATQFHPEKSGPAGLDVLRGFLEGGSSGAASASASGRRPAAASGTRGLARRVIACLDVRANDAGDLVVTKGDQYDVREEAAPSPSPSSPGGDAGGDVRNLGKPVDLARRYYEEGADEVTFLNITGFRETPLGDLPMLEVLRRASEGVFVPLTVGGGIRPTVDPDGTKHSALAVAAEYFRSGADKVSIGSDAVEAALAYYARGGVADGTSAIEQISWVRCCFFCEGWGARGWTRHPKQHSHTHARKSPPHRTTAPRPSSCPSTRAACTWGTRPTRPDPPCARPRPALGESSGCGGSAR